MQLSFHGVTKIKILEYMVDGEGYRFKVVKIAISDRDNTHDISAFVRSKNLTVRKVEHSEIKDSLVDRIIEVVPNE